MVRWKLELAACLVVLVVPLIIVGTLYPHAGQPAPQWPILSLNALLSIYSVVFRTCLTFTLASCIGQLQWSWFSANHSLYDMVRYNDAANGPLGSIQLLWTQGIRQPLTAFGALIVVLSVAIDPFIQQILVPMDCEIKVAGATATLPRTNLLYNSTGMLDDDFEYAHYNLYTPTYTPETFMSWQCPSGNCTFSETYGTLGFCSSCEDWSTRVTVSANDACSDWKSSCKFSSSLYVGEDYNDDSFTWVNMTTVEMSSSTEMVVAETWRADNSSAMFGAVILKGATTDSMLGIDPFTSLNITGCDEPSSPDNWRCRGYGAASCVLRPCVRFYNATVDRGQLKEQLVSQSDPVDWGLPEIPVAYLATNIMWAVVDTQCISQDESQSLTERGYAVDSARWLPYNYSTQASSPFENDTLATSLLEHECLYALDDYFAGRFMDIWFTNGINGTVLSTNSSGSISLTGGTPPVIRYSDFDGPPFLQYLFTNTAMDFDDIDGAFANISDMATAWIRTLGNASFSSPAGGDVMHYATCTRVRWVWVTFPIILALMTVVFFGLAAVSSAVQQVPVWKLSPLAWVMRWGDPSQGAGPLSSATIDDMEQRSRDIVVVLDKNPDYRVKLVGPEEPGEFNSHEVGI